LDKVSLQNEADQAHLISLDFLSDHVPQISTIKISPFDSNTVAVGTRRGGVFLSKDFGSTWTQVRDSTYGSDPISSGSTPTVVSAISFGNQCPDEMFISSRGRGAWHVCSVPPPAVRPATPTGLKVQSYTCFGNYIGPVSWNPVTGSAIRYEIEEQGGPTKILQGIPNVPSITTTQYTPIDAPIPSPPAPPSWYMALKVRACSGMCQRFSYKSEIFSN
jgi:hypothetical protein